MGEKCKIATWVPKLKSYIFHLAPPVEIDLTYRNLYLTWKHSLGGGDLKMLNSHLGRAN